MAKAGRRPGQPGTREQILAAARALFAEQGYDGTTIRAIAARAEVNPALVHHYFGQKEKVFAAALAFPANPEMLRAAIIEGPREQAGERFVRFFIGVWSDPASRQPFLALLRSVASNDNAARMMREFLARAIVKPVGTALGVSEHHMEAAAAQLVGLAVVRYIVGVEPLASLPDEEVIALVTPTIQGYFDAAVDTGSQQAQN